MNVSSELKRGLVVLVSNRFRLRKWINVSKLSVFLSDFLSSAINQLLKREYILPPSSCSSNVEHVPANYSRFGIDHTYRRGARSRRHIQLKAHLTYTLRCHLFSLLAWPERQRL
jgi:hypothetical protein